MKNSIYKIGDKFTKKNSRDSMIMEVKTIYYVTDGSDPTYVMKRLYPTVLDETVCISESVLIELYNKINN